ncbi:hypothetical protein LEN26_004405 [Aphanomyces euteiches]|nr:hypothetical protein LEN26_004405 [Aphanomyces euteiches]
MSGFGPAVTVKKRSHSDAWDDRVAASLDASSKIRRPTDVKTEHAYSSDDGDDDYIEENEQMYMPYDEKLGALHSSDEDDDERVKREMSGSDTEDETTKVEDDDQEDEEPWYSGLSEVATASQPDTKETGAEEDKNSIAEAWTVMRGICTELSHAEVHAINHDLPISGPPSCPPDTLDNAMKTYFRWPIRPCNLLRTNFAQDAECISIDLNEVDGREDNVEVAQTCLPALVAPLCNLVTKECRRYIVSTPKQDEAHILRAKLSHLVRSSTAFVDTLLETLLVENAVALQGNEKEYSSRAWSSVQNTPCANYRFVSETVQQPLLSRHLAPATIERIQARLHAIYDDSWKHEDAK